MLPTRHLLPRRRISSPNNESAAQKTCLLQGRLICGVETAWRRWRRSNMCLSSAPLCRGSEWKGKANRLCRPFMGIITSAWYCTFRSPGPKRVNLGPLYRREEGFSYGAQKSTLLHSKPIRCPEDLSDAQNTNPLPRIPIGCPEDLSDAQNTNTK